MCLFAIVKQNGGKKSMQNSHGFDFECVLCRMLEWAGVWGVSVLMPTPFSGQQSVHKFILSYGTVDLYDWTSSGRGCVFLLIPHIEWPICTWICRKINKDSVLTWLCCCIPCMPCLPYSFWHNVNVNAFRFIQFLRTLLVCASDSISVRAFGLHCVAKPIFRFQSLESSALRTSDVFVCFSTHLFGSNDNIISESIYIHVRIGT